MATSMLGSIAAIAFIFALIIPVSLYFAWAAVILWGWFIVPTFGLPQITILQAWGIGLTLSMMRPRMTAQKTETDWASGFVAVILGPPLALALGYAIRFWWM
jgi:hypothetical protein